MLGHEEVPVSGHCSVPDSCLYVVNGPTVRVHPVDKGIPYPVSPDCHTYIYQVYTRAKLVPVPGNAFINVKLAFAIKNRSSSDPLICHFLSP